MSGALSYGVGKSMAAGLLRTARSGSVVLSLYPLSQPRGASAAPNNTRGWRRSADGASAGRWSRGEWRAELRGRGIDGRRPVAHGANGLSRPLSLSIVAAARRAPRRTTPAVGADPPMGLRLVGGAEVSGALSYGVGNRWPPACCARRDRAQSSSLFIHCRSRADERRAEQHPRLAPIRRWGFGWSVEPR